LFGVIRPQAPAVFEHRAGPSPNIDHQIVAANWLSDRGYGRPKETLEVLDQSSQTQRLELLRKLSDDERAQLRAILTKALNGTTDSGSDATDGRGDENPASQDDDREIVLPDNGTPVIETEPVNDAIVADDSKSDADRPLPHAAN
jgi:hypothetical protein